MKMFCFKNSALQLPPSVQDGRSGVYLTLRWGEQCSGKAVSSNMHMPCRHHCTCFAGEERGSEVSDDHRVH